MLGLKKTLDRKAKTNGVRWYGHVIRREDDNIRKKAMMMEVNGQRKRGRPKMTWKRRSSRGLDLYAGIFFVNKNFLCLFNLFYVQLMHIFCCILIKK